MAAAGNVGEVGGAVNNPFGVGAGLSAGGNGGGTDGLNPQIAQQAIHARWLCAGFT